MSLTLPQAHMPVIVEAGRSNLTLEWTSDYFPQPQQQQQQQQQHQHASSSGFNLTVCEVAGMASAALKGLLGGASSTQDGVVDGCVVFTWSTREFSNILVSPETSSLNSDYTTPTQQFRTSVVGLRPNTTYMAR